MIKRPQFLKQKNMIRVLYALIPILLCGIFFFGLRVLAVTVVSFAAAFCTEWIMSTKRNGKISFACFVTASLYALSLPPTVPLWITAVGAIIAILFGKEAFGGFGKNVFNPAIVGRAFVYVCFPIELTSQFVPAFNSLPGGFAHWSYTSAPHIPSILKSANLSVADAITTATPMYALREYGFSTDLLQLLLGSIHSFFTFNKQPMICAAGSIGEVSAVALIIAAIYLIVTKTALPRLMISTLIGAVGMNILLRTILSLDHVPPVGFSLLSGGLLYGAVFMITDPVSAPKRVDSQILYGLLFGALIIFLRFKSVFIGSVGFSLLLANICAPSLDLWLNRFRPLHEKKGSNE